MITIRTFVSHLARLSLHFLPLKYSPHLKGPGNTSPVANSSHAQKLNAMARLPRPHRYLHVPIYLRLILLSSTILLLLGFASATVFSHQTSTSGKSIPTRSRAVIPVSTLRPTQTPIPTPDPTPTPTPSASASLPSASSSNTSPTPPPPLWTTLLSQPAPDCNNPNGTLWNAGSTPQYSCQSNGLLMQRVAGGFFPEMDLDNVNGTIYSQTKFRVQTQVTFQNPGDTSTSAALLVQTPQVINNFGGYICAVNPHGQWQLQEVRGAKDMPIIRSGTVSLDLAQPTTITVYVLNGNLYFAINGTWVVAALPDNLNPNPGAASLMVTNGGGASSAIVFANFELQI